MTPPVIYRCHIYLPTAGAIHMCLMLSQMMSHTKLYSNPKPQT